MLNDHKIDFVGHHVYLDIAIDWTIWQKARFHDATEIDKINHGCVQFGRWVMQTCRHRPMDIGLRGF